MSFGRFQSDLYISFFFFVLASIFVVSQYAALSLRETPESLMPGIPLGDLEYIVTSRGRCVGKIELRSSYHEHYDIDGSAKFLVRYAGVTQEIDIEYSAGFNALRQLAAAFLTLKRGQDQLRVGLKEVNPMFFQFQATLAGKDYEIRRQVPGPIEVIESKDERLNIRYRYLPSLGTFSGATQLNPLMNTLQLQILQQDDEKGGLVCDEDSLEAINLDPLVSQLGSVMQYLQQAKGGL